jgi:hypothetical protein
MESERLQSLVLEKEVDAEMCKKELEMQKVEIANLNQKISEVIFCPSSKIVMTEYHEIPLAFLRITSQQLRLLVQAGDETQENQYLKGIGFIYAYQTS